MAKAPTKHKLDPRVDAQIESAPEFARPVLSHLRTLIHQAARWKRQSSGSAPSSCTRAKSSVRWARSKPIAASGSGVRACRRCCGRAASRGTTPLDRSGGSPPSPTCPRMTFCCNGSRRRWRSPRARLQRPKAPAPRPLHRRPERPCRRLPRASLRSPRICCANCQGRRSRQKLPRLRTQLPQGVCGVDQRGKAPRDPGQASCRGGRWIAEGKRRNWKYEAAKRIRHAAPNP